MQAGPKKPMSLSNTLGAMGVVIIALSLPAGWYLVYSKNLERSSAAAAAETLEVVDSALHMVEAVARERGPSNAAMGTREAALDRTALDTARERSDRALAHARQAASTLRDPSLRDSTQAALSALQAHLSKTRQRMDDHLGKATALREATLPNQLIQEMFVAADMASQLSRGLAVGTNSVSDHHQSLRTLVTRATIAAALRDYAGRMGSVVSMALIRGTPLTAEEQRMLSRIHGRSEEMRRHLDLNILLSTDAATQQALARVDQRFFKDGLNYVERTQQVAPVSASAFAERYVPMIEPIVDLRNQYMRTARDAAATSLERSQQAQIGWTLLSLAQNLLVLTLLWMVKRRVLKPLSQAAESLRRITSTPAGEEEDNSKSTSADQDEVSRLTELVGSLVEQSQARLQLEARQEKQLLELRTLVGVDPLTGLENRRSVELRAKALLAEGKRHGFEVCALVLDVDHFKLVNDRYGHPVGDEALRTLASVLQLSLRCEDISGRVGGEEFMVLLGYCPLNHALDKAEMLRRRVELRPIHIKGLDEPLFITVSVGVASTNAHGHQWDSLTSAADRALYQAKREGRNRVVADDASNSAAGALSSDSLVSPPN